MSAIRAPSQEIRKLGRDADFAQDSDDFLRPDVEALLPPCLTPHALSRFAGAALRSSLKRDYRIRVLRERVNGTLTTEWHTPRLRRNILFVVDRVVGSEFTVADDPGIGTPAKAEIGNIDDRILGRIGYVHDVNRERVVAVADLGRDIQNSVIAAQSFHNSG